MAIIVAYIHLQFLRYGGNASSCSVTITSTTLGQYVCTATGTRSCTIVNVGGGNFTSCPSDWPIQIDQGDSWGNCCKYTCSGGGWNSSPSSSTCYIWQSSSSCPSGYTNSGQEATCPSGTTKLNNSYCMQ